MRRDTVEELVVVLLTSKFVARKGNTAGQTLDVLQKTNGLYKRTPTRPGGSYRRRAELPATGAQLPSAARG